MLHVSATNRELRPLPLGDRAGLCGCRDTGGRFLTLSKDGDGLKLLFRWTGTRDRVKRRAAGNCRAELSVSSLSGAEQEEGSVPCMPGEATEDRRMRPGPGAGSYRVRPRPRRLLRHGGAVERLHRSHCGAFCSSPLLSRLQLHGGLHDRRLHVQLRPHWKTGAVLKGRAPPGHAPRAS